MAKFTAGVPLKIHLPGGFEIDGAVGATHRIPDALYDEFVRDQVPLIPGGVTWVSQDETSSIPALPIGQTDVSGLTASLAAKYDKTGGTISGAVTVTGALVAQAGTSVKTLNGSFIYADQYSSIQAAHDALPATGGTIVIPAGTYTTSGANPILSITKSNFRVIGAGRGATIFQWASSVPEYLITGGAANLEDIVVEGIEFDGSALPTSATQYAAVNFTNTGTRRITLRDLYIHQMPGTAETFAVNYGNVMGGVIDGVYVSSCGGSGIAVSGSTAIAIANCVADSCGLMGFTVSSAETSVKISSGITITNCVSRRNAFSGFNIESTEHMALAGLVAEGNGRWGIVFATSGIAGIAYSRYVSGAGIIVSNNGTASAGSYAGIILSGDGTTGVTRINLSGVLAVDSQSAKTQLYGVDDVLGTSNCTIAGDLRGNLTGEANLTAGSNNQYRPTRFIGASVGLSAALTLNSASTTLVPWTSEVHDDDGFHSLVSNKTKLTIPAGLAGKYRVSVSAAISQNATSSRNVRILRNSSPVATTGGTTTTGAFEISLPVYWTGNLSAGDVIEVDAYQDSGSALTMLTASWLMIERA